MDNQGKAALGRYLARYNNHQTAAARDLGYVASRLNQVLTGERPMSEAMAARIHIVTNGEVSMLDLSLSLRSLDDETRASKVA